MSTLSRVDRPLTSFSIGFEKREGKVTDRIAHQLKLLLQEGTEFDCAEDLEISIELRTIYRRAFFLRLYRQISEAQFIANRTRCRDHGTHSLAKCVG